MTRVGSIISASLAALSILGFAAGLPDATSARPVVTFKAVAVPIPVNLARAHGPSYPRTGAILGAPAAGEAVWTISGSEYFESPSPLTWIKVYTPTGVKLHWQGFATCTETVLREHGPAGCPKKSLAGPLGEGTGAVSFGGERVRERVTVQQFFRPGDGVLFYVSGSTPVSLEVFARGTVLAANPPFDFLFTGAVPLVETVPGLDGSIEQLKITFGAAFKERNKLVSFITTPSTCPPGGFPIKSELSFLNGETITSTTKIACPTQRD